MPPDIVVGQQRPFLAVEIHRALDGGLGEIRPVPVPDEFDAVTILAGFGRRAGIGVEIDDAVFLRDLADGVGDAGVDRADQEAALVAGDHPLGDPAARGGCRFGVEMAHLDLAAEHAALVVELGDGHRDAAPLAGARIGVLAARIRGDADADGLVACRRPDPVVLPRTVERSHGPRGGRCLQQPSPADMRLRHHFLPIGAVRDRNRGCSLPAEGSRIENLFNLCQ